MNSPIRYLVKRKYSDDSILNGLKKNPKKWQTTTYHFFKEDLRRYCLSKLRYEEDTFESAYNDTMSAFFERVEKGTYEQRSKITTFLISILHNKYIDESRKIQNKIALSSQDISEMLDLTDDTRGMFEHFLVKNGLQQIEKTLNLIGKNCFEIFQKAAYGFNSSEIAKMLNLKDADTVKSRRYNCKKKFLALMLDKNMFYGNE